ncbi:YueI family protein [Halobacillus seohaensis]|uniref:YueI family protein n=1 Tax=Halobacillus seohaensis TaxID=447421 RepID=A0ABW2ELF5_9BACI
MKKANVDDYLQEGIYGSKETKPSERKKYLGTLRERVVLVLTKSQVMQEVGLEELSKRIKEHKDSKLLLNGEISYRFRKPYKSLANQNDIHTTTVSNQENETDLGAILTVDYAVEKENIHVEIKETPERESREKGGWKEFFKSLFKPLG